MLGAWRADFLKFSDMFFLRFCGQLFGRVWGQFLVVLAVPGALFFEVFWKRPKTFKCESRRGESTVFEVGGLCKTSFSDASQMLPRCFQMHPRCLPDASQMLPDASRCLPDASRCHPDARGSTARIPQPGLQSQDSTASYFGNPSDFG